MGVRVLIWSAQNERFWGRKTGKFFPKLQEFARIGINISKNYGKTIFVCGKITTFANGNNFGMGKLTLKAIITIAYFVEVIICTRDILEESFCSRTTKALMLVTLSFVWVILYVFVIFCINRLYDY